jgi:hypothetical protein
VTNKQWILQRYFRQYLSDDAHKIVCVCSLTNTDCSQSFDLPGTHPRELWDHLRLVHSVSPNEWIGNSKLDFLKRLNPRGGDRERQVAARLLEEKSRAQTAALKRVKIARMKQEKSVTSIKSAWPNNMKYSKEDTKFVRGGLPSLGKRR